MLVPLYGFVQGDTLGLLVLAHADWSIAEVALALGQSARLRTGRVTEAEETHGVLLFQGRALDPNTTVSSAGLLPLSRIDLRFHLPQEKMRTEWSKGAAALSGEESL